MKSKSKWQYIKLAKDKQGRTILIRYTSNGKLIKKDNPDVSPFTKMFSKKKNSKGGK